MKNKINMYQQIKKEFEVQVSKCQQMVKDFTSLTADTHNDLTECLNENIEGNKALKQFALTQKLYIFFLF